MTLHGVQCTYSWRHKADIKGASDGYLQHITRRFSAFRDSNRPVARLESEYSTEAVKLFAHILDHNAAKMPDELRGALLQEWRYPATEQRHAAPTFIVPMQVRRCMPLRLPAFSGLPVALDCVSQRVLLCSCNVQRCATRAACMLSMANGNGMLGVSATLRCAEQCGGYGAGHGRHTCKADCQIDQVVPNVQRRPQRDGAKVRRLPCRLVLLARLPAQALEASQACLLKAGL